MEKNPRRRWFTFSLRTVFVVVTLMALFAAWSGYQINWIRQRRAILTNPPQGVYFDREYEFYSDDGPDPQVPSPGPWPLNLFGEKAIGGISVYTPHAANVDSIKALFPEAKVHYFKHAAERTRAYPNKPIE